MFCPKCGSEIEEGATFCSACGNKVEDAQPNNFEPVVNNNYNYNAPIRSGNNKSALLAVAEQRFPMGWFKFLSYFACFAAAAGCVLFGILAFIIASMIEIPSCPITFQNDIKLAHMVLGGALVVIAVLAIYTRIQLASFKKNASIFVVLCFAAVAATLLIYLYLLNSAYYAMGYIPEGDVRFMKILTFLVWSGAIGCAIMGFLNYIYFRKRKECFVN